MAVLSQILRGALCVFLQNTVVLNPIYATAPQVGTLLGDAKKSGGFDERMQASG